MYEDIMMRLKDEQKRLQELNLQDDNEVKALSHWHNHSSITLYFALLYSVHIECTFTQFLLLLIKLERL